jgi:hypothetical protein
MYAIGYSDGRGHEQNGTLGVAIGLAAICVVNFIFLLWDAAAPSAPHRPSDQGAPDG